ncbi:hypothetical protein AAJ76_2120002780 [Vairimorpha ceranae]|uniref:Uncharacterized protein n=1 Tax=Vairimorpha ceranae TaxID=40302 RepID=A0A0F9WL50_9MICR|nr:hypothetical protein AAJ76_2120002780 [Vairimorpha ceranae]KKO73833.1 hypothetical protein AAJ76_2120002780 [Vairimorpha ceranae]
MIKFFKKYMQRNTLINRRSQTITVMCHNPHEINFWNAWFYLFTSLFVWNLPHFENLNF